MMLLQKQTGDGDFKKRRRSDKCHLEISAEKKPEL